LPRVADPELAERRRRQILEAALTCFRRRGFHQATMQEICAEARISPGALYRYFPSKNDIIAAIAEEERAEADAAFAQVEAGGDLVEHLVSLAGLVFESFQDKGEASEGGTLIADVIAEAMRDPALAQRFVEIAKPTQARLAQLIADAQAKGEVDPTLNPQQTAHVLTSAIDGLGLRLAILRDGDIASTQLAFREMLVRYLGVAPRKTAKPKSKILEEQIG
jgi:AcrR family transcriptional regulator